MRRERERGCPSPDTHLSGWLRACVKQPDWRGPGAAKIFSRPALALTLAASSTPAKSDTLSTPPPPTFLASLPPCLSLHLHLPA